MRYTTRTEAIQAEIIDPIQSSEAVTDAAAEYDIEAIADEVIGSYQQGFAAQVGPDKFWTIVANHASATHKVKVEFTITETVTRTGTVYVDPAEVCAAAGVEGSLSDLSSEDIGEYVATDIVESQLQITSYLVEDRTARAWRAYTEGDG